MSVTKRDVSAQAYTIIRDAQAGLTEAQLGLNAVCAGVLSTLGLQGKVVAIDPGEPGKRKPSITVEIPDKPKAAKRGKEK